MTTDTDVLIIGAGPTGLVLALWLTKLGVRVRIVDKTAEPGTTSRALAVHARTLELYEQLDLADAVMARGYTVPGARLWVGGRQAARVPFEQIASELTPYGFLHIFPQDEHERLLVERLETLGVQVERSTELLDCEDDDERIRARLRTADGSETMVSATFLAGCDGARSRVRDIMGTGFPGGTYPQIFYVADVEGEGLAFNGDLNVELDEADFLAVFPLADAGRVRLIGVVRPREGKDIESLTFDDISDRATRSLKFKIHKVNWFSVYHVHHRVTEHFRKGRCFLLGDAAHIHTPVGGQGMNTGIGDAINFAWKVQTVLDDRAPDTLLDSFEAERRAFALRLVQTTDRFFNLAASEGHLAEIIRTRLAPFILPQIVKFESARDYIFRTISQITLNYCGKGLDEGHAGSIHGGERLPWVRINGGDDNYEALKHIGWQMHVYGDIQEQIKILCEDRNIKLRAYPWRETFQAAGLQQNALYVIRPDTYIGYVSPTQNADAVLQYFDRIQIRP